MKTVKCRSAAGGVPHVCCPGEPVVLGWTGWTSWTFTTTCSARCGGGSRRRTRFCRGQDRDQCRGERVQEVSCNEAPCGELRDLPSLTDCSCSSHIRRLELLAELVLLLRLLRRRVPVQVQEV